MKTGGNITYFKPDERKAGGAYVTATGAVIKVDDFERANYHAGRHEDSDG